MFNISHVSVVLPGMNSDAKRTEFSPLSEHDGLIERYKSKNLDGILELHNKTPVWNDETQSYVLNFHGRVTQVNDLIFILEIIINEILCRHQ